MFKTDKLYNKTSSLHSLHDDINDRKTEGGESGGAGMIFEAMFSFS